VRVVDATQTQANAKTPRTPRSERQERFPSWRFEFGVLGVLAFIFLVSREKNRIKSKILRDPV
jgi:hypothetical protein